MSQSNEAPGVAASPPARTGPDVPRSERYDYPANPWRGMHVDDVYARLMSHEGELPWWPETRLQAGYAGTAGVALLRNAFKFVNIMDEDGAFFDGWKGFDYGCGWGRFASVLLSKGSADQLDLYDAWPVTIQHLQQLNYKNKIALIAERLVAGELPADTYDLGLSFSVFTHLSPEAMTQNLPVLAASLKPTGRFYLTVRHAEFIDHKYGDRHDELNDRLASDGVVFLDSGGDVGSTKSFGDTIVTEQYLADLVGAYAKVTYLGQPHTLQHVYRLERV